ncbi:hypothetical protein JCGZ_07522 [Jatropha curcas]|uniref:Pectinesterase inhibitor domain-containing protein n=1 Tax=Jatropha curcas TaxID=180498 RepID=A0A067KCJ6_JATCU|nr:cell wall / vacuolar inhibitor of fructosidase 2 [Jatropha curcas]KDP33951.1 hypothetical protein JCGZ_07522 [Jatropha curcas]
MASSKIRPSLSLANYLFLMSYFIFLGYSSRLQYSKENNSKDLISSTCNHTLYYQECVFSLRSDPNSKTADLRGLANIALNISIAYGSETLTHISDLKTKTSKNDTNSSCLSDCVEQYNDAVEDLQEAIEALRIRSLDTLKTLVSSAMTDSDTCEEGFEESGYGSPFANRNLYFSKLCSNFLAISNLLS